MWLLSYTLLASSTALSAHLSFISLVGPALFPSLSAPPLLSFPHLILLTWVSPPHRPTCTSFYRQLSLYLILVLNQVIFFVCLSPCFCVKVLNYCSSQLSPAFGCWTHLVTTCATWENKEHRYNTNIISTRFHSHVIKYFVIPLSMSYRCTRMYPLVSEISRKQF